MNALLTDGFDRDFDEILEKNKDILSLVDQKSLLPNLDMSTIPGIHSPTQNTQQIFRKIQKKDRRFFNFRRRNQRQTTVLRHHKLTRQTSATNAYKNIRKKYFG